MITENWFLFFYYDELQKAKSEEEKQKINCQIKEVIEKEKLSKQELIEYNKAKIQVLILENKQLNRDITDIENGDIILMKRGKFNEQPIFRVL